MAITSIYTSEQVMIIIAIAVVLIFIIKYYYKNKYSKQEIAIRHDFYLREKKIKEELQSTKALKQEQWHDHYKNEKRLKQEISEITAKYNDSVQNLTIARRNLVVEKAKFVSIINNEPPFCKIASLIADAESLVYDQVADYLEDYRRASKSAEIVRDLKHKYRELMANFKELQYEHEYILSMFPDLSKYIDGFSFELTHDNDEYDHSRDWLSDEEYAQLSEDDRNQRALDNWVRGHKKTKLEVGYDYEMYIGHYYRTDKRYYWQVRQCGIEDGLNDLGRDIIARRQDTANNQIVAHVIQCKNWGQEKQIHENVIAQLYGTAKMYEMEHSKESLKVVPVLATTTELSDSAKRFAEYLGVCVRVVPLGDYPRIKCNVSQTTNERIYHLPFDQQYYNVKIENTGEYYVSTVKEAVQRGFRRAFRHIVS